MTMKQKMLRWLIAGLVGFTAATTAVGGGGLPGSAASCLRSIAIDPQVTVSEASRSLTFVVYTNSCAAPGQVSFEAFDGTAEHQGPFPDYELENGTLTWAEGDLSRRKITATIFGDQIREASLEDFKVILTNPSQSIRVASGRAQARIFDDDMQGRLTATDDRICLISGDGSCLPTQPPVGGAASFGPTIIYTIEPGHAIIAPIVLNQANPFGTFIHFRTVDGGLVGGSDYVPVDKDIPIPPNTTVVYVQIELLPPAYSQPGQSFFTQLTNYPAGFIADPNGTVTMVA
ncbi:MAG TPA: Calx-beta domain-containing protein [Candidatus Limnocylindrales bacterium]|nr:Calx-beta domain-containing protein [Candidatus Limnocylindrales bacterium]